MEFYSGRKGKITTRAGKWIKPDIKQGNPDSERQTPYVLSRGWLLASSS